MLSLTWYLHLLAGGFALDYTVSKNIIAQLPDRLGAPEALRWCENGVTSAFPRVVDTLLSHKISMGATKLLLKKFEQHFDSETGELIIPPAQWAKLECENVSGRYVAAAPIEWPFVPDPQVAHITGNPQPPDQFCEILWHFGDNLLANGSLPKMTEAPLSPWTAEDHLGQHLSKLQISEVVHESLLPPEISPYLNLQNWSLETLVAVAKILPAFKRFFTFPDGAPLKTRMSLFADTMCRFSDVEATVPGLHEITPFTCAVVDMVLSAIMCTGVAAVPRRGAVCESASSLPQIRQFPTATCYPPRTSFQREGPWSERLRAFNWDDKDLYIPLDLEDLRPLPGFIPKKIRSRELLTYLTLFRASMLIYPAVDKMICIDDLPPDFQLIPGWDLVHVFNVQLPRDPMFEVDPLQNHLPMMFMSQSSKDKCHFNIAVRGTASRLEWLLDFNYWTAPLAAPDGSLGGKHQGYTDIVNTVVGYIKGALERLSKQNGCTCFNTRVTVHGHSLGGGVGQLLALHLAVFYSEELQCNLRVDGVFFASPRVMVGAAVDRYRETVNGRHLIDIADPLYHLPCHTENARLGYARCGREHASLPGVGRDEYGENDGRILLDVDFVRAGANVTVRHKYTSVDPPYVTDLEIHEMYQLGKQKAALQEDTPADENIPIYRAAEFGHDPLHDAERKQLSQDILFDAALASSAFSRFSKRMITAAVNFVVPNSAMKLMPTKQELAAAHVASFGCALSVACHGLPWAEFKWWCDGLPEGVIDL